MKKITLLFVAMLLSIATYSQQTISFESAEGYTLGDINAQNGWISTPTGETTNIENQLVTNEQASDGSNSLKLVQEIAFPVQSSPVVGAFYNYATAVPETSATFSADMYIDTFNSTDTSNYIFGLVNVTGGSFITYVMFTFEGDIAALVDDGTGTNTVTLEDTLADWTPLTWFNVRMELNAGALEIFIDNVSIYQGLVATPNLGIEQVRFAHNNATGFAYVDNFRTNDEDLSVSEFAPNTFSHFYNTDLKTLNLNSTNTILSSVEIFDVLGKRVLNNTLNGNEASVDVSSFKDGIYLAKVSTETGVKTVKFVKS